MIVIGIFALMVLAFFALIFWFTRTPKCKHILAPGENNCSRCGERIRFEDGP
jgi:hypothetical protein